MSGWQVGLLIVVPLGFVAIMGVFAWASSTGRDERWGASSSSWLKRHPILWGAIYGGLWLIPAGIWASRGHVGMAVFYAVAFVAFGVLGWRTVTRAAAAEDQQPRAGNR